jgi:hypothetical protein
MPLFSTTAFLVARQHLQFFGLTNWCWVKLKVGFVMEFSMMKDLHQKSNRHRSGTSSDETSVPCLQKQALSMYEKYRLIVLNKARVTVAAS